MALTNVVGYTDSLPPIGQGVLFEYVFGGNGIFVRGAREGLQVIIPVLPALPGLLRGFGSLAPRVEMAYPRVPAALVSEMLRLSKEARAATGEPIEALFHLAWNTTSKGWALDVPPQTRTSGSVRALDDGSESSYARSLIHAHSHHEMRAFFSGIDDKEQRGFRIYAVFGDIFTAPTLRVRAGMYDYFHEIPAGEIFELPPEVSPA